MLPRLEVASLRAMTVTKRRAAIVTGLLLIAPLAAMTPSPVSAAPTSTTTTTTTVPGSFTPSVVQSTECINETGNFRWELVLSVDSTPESTWTIGLGGGLRDFTDVSPAGDTPTTGSKTVTGESTTDVNGDVRFIVQNIGANGQDVDVSIAAPNCAPSTTTTVETSTTTTVETSTTAAPTTPTTLAPATTAPPTNELPEAGSYTLMLAAIGALLIAIGFGVRRSAAR